MSFSTVLDLAKVDIALDEGMLISADSHTGVLAPTRTSNAEAIPYGVGWHAQQYAGRMFDWHSR